MLAMPELFFRSFGVAETVGRDVGADAGRSAEAIDKDIYWVAIALWNETLMIFVNTGINDSD